MVRPLLALVAALLLSAVASAAGTVQLVLHGAVHRDGGMPIELLVEAGGHEASFRGVVARDTRAEDVAGLLERRLKAAGISYGRGHDAPGQGPVSIFLEDVEKVRLRLGGGLRASVTACDEKPAALRLLPPRLVSEPKGAYVRLAVTCEGRDHLLTKEVELDLADVATTDQRVADLLARRATQAGLRSERPTNDSWATSGASSGEAAIGASIELFGDADWGIELELSPREGRR